MSARAMASAEKALRVLQAARDDYAAQCLHYETRELWHELFSIGARGAAG